MFCFVAAFNVLRPFGTSGVVNETDTLLSISKHDAKQHIHGIKYLSFTLFLPLKQINKQTNTHRDTRNPTQHKYTHQEQKHINPPKQTGNWPDTSIGKLYLFIRGEGKGRNPEKYTVVAF